MVTTLISNFGETVSVSRPGAGTMTDGRWVAGVPSTFDAVMSIQPLNGDDIEELPEGQRTRNIIKGYTATELQTTNEGSGIKADVVTYNSKTFEVQTVERWRGDLNHWKVLMTELLR